MLNHQHRVPSANQRIQRFQQHRHIVVMQARCGLIEDKEGRCCVLLCQERCQLHALTLAARQRATRLTQLHIPYTYILQRLQPVDNLLTCRIFGEKLYRLINRHLQHIVNVLAAIQYIQHILLKAFALAVLALQHHIRHKLHLYPYRSLALAGFAPTTWRVKREMRWCEAQLFAQLLLGVQFAYLVVCLQIGHWVRTR